MNKKVKLFLIGIITVLILLSFYYEYLKINDNLLLILDNANIKEEAEIVKFNNQILQDTLHLRSNFYFQITIVTAFVLVNFLFRVNFKKSDKSA